VRRSCCCARSGIAAGKKIAGTLLRGTGRVADRISGQIRAQQGPSVAVHHGTPGEPPGSSRTRMARSAPGTTAD
jgi:hypothetical protein